MILWVIIGAVALIAVFCAFAWYTIVDPSEAHLVVTPNEKFVASPDEEVGTKRTYFAIPRGIPFFGRSIRRMSVVIQELAITQETIEKGQARYKVKSSTKYRIKNVKKAAETFTNDQELKEMLKEVVQSSVRAVTVKYDVVDARAQKQKISEEIAKEMTDDLSKWGLELVNFQLVEFSDTDKSEVVSNISLRREVEIEATTREQNAEKLKQARIKEAEAEEKAKQREIERDKLIGEQEELKKQKIAEKQKEAEEKRYEVVKVQVIKQAEIDKEKAIILANQEKETEAIKRDQKKLEGQGDRERDEERAKGLAAPIREKGLAEAEAKEKLQAALNKFGDEAIRALVAEKIVEKDKDVGVAIAKALENADLKVFSGGGDTTGFDLGKMIESMSVSNATTADAILNKMARPNDLGLTALGVKSLSEKSEDKIKTKKEAVAKKKAEDEDKLKTTKKA